MLLTLSMLEINSEFAASALFSFLFAVKEFKLVFSSTLALLMPRHIPQTFKYTLFSMDYCLYRSI